MQRKTHGTRWRCGTLQGKATPENSVLDKLLLVIMCNYMHIKYLVCVVQCHSHNKNSSVLKQAQQKSFRKTQPHFKSLVLIPVSLKVFPYNECTFEVCFLTIILFILKILLI